MNDIQEQSTGQSSVEVSIRQTSDEQIIEFRAVGSSQAIEDAAIVCLDSTLHTAKQLDQPKDQSARYSFYSLCAFLCGVTAVAWILGTIALNIVNSQQPIRTEVRN